MNRITLSYIYSTKNKIDFVKKSLVELIKHKDVDEEIIVIDGNSTDGTVSYLQNLKKSGSIDTLISENDLNESHALNKGILLAKGEIIKFITDDDIFFYDSIKKCKHYLLNNNDIEILFGSTYDVHYLRPETLRFLKISLDRFLKYRDFNVPFPFTGLSLMFRKNIISKFGLMSTLTIAPDTEFSYRITKMMANLVYYNNPVSIRIENELSNFSYETGYKFLHEDLSLQSSFGIISLRTFMFLKIKFQIKAFLGKLIYRNKIRVNTLEGKTTDDQGFYESIIASVRKEFVENLPNHELFIKNKNTK